MMDRKCTRHNWCALRKFSKSSKIDFPLFDLHFLLFTLALVILIRILTLGRLLISGAIPGEVRRTSTSKAAVVTIHTVGLLKTWPWPRLLLLRHMRSSYSLPLGWPENPSAFRFFSRWRISLWGPGNCILHQMIPRLLRTRGSSRCLPLLLSTMRCNAIVLSNGHIH